MVNDNLRRLLGELAYSITGYAERAYMRQDGADIDLAVRDTLACIKDLCRVYGVRYETANNASFTHTLERLLDIERHKAVRVYGRGGRDGRSGQSGKGDKRT